MKDTAPSAKPGRRFFWGLALALGLAVALGHGLLGRALEQAERSRAEREALVALEALSQVVEHAASTGKAPATPEGSGFAAELGAPAASPEPKPEAAPAEGSGMGIGAELSAAAAGAAPAADASGDAVRRAVARFAQDHSEVKAIRVVDLEERQLTASTAAADQGEKAAPRKLQMDEKPLFDLTQALRSAVEGNREGAGGGVRAEEIERRWSRGLQGRPDTLTLATPLERDGAVVGLVQTESELAVAARAPLVPALLAWLVPVAAFFLLGFVLPAKRALLAGVAALLLLAGLAVYGQGATRRVTSAERRTAEQVAAAVSREADRAAAILSGIGAPAEPALTPASWDVDLHRKPLGQVSAPGTVDEARLAAQLRDTARGMRRTTISLTLLGLAVLGYVGFGWASRTGRALVEHRQAYLYTLPALAGMLVLVFFPFFYGIALSFTNANIYNSDKPVADIWVGLDNYKDILSDVHVSKATANGRVWDYGNFYWTLGFTILWTVSNVSIGVTLGLLLALSLNTKGLAFRAGYRVLLILPWAVPSYISALIFRGMFHQQYGVVNQVLQIVGFAPIAWFDRPLTSFLAVLSTNGWLSFPFMMVVSLGALQSIPSDLYEAARVDGAGRWQQFRSITLPSLKPALVPAIILSVIWTFNMFNIIYLVSAGQPSGATEILITQAYKLAFEQYRYGYAAAYSTVIFLILLIYGTWQNRVTRATEAVAE